MKITKQTIAAAGFAALLFAPLAQAQTSSATANIDIVVIGSAMAIEATDISFGAFSSGDASQNVILTCTADDATGFVNDSASDDATCGVIKVLSGTDGGFDYKLAVSATPLTGRTGAAVGSTLNPTFNIFDFERSDAPDSAVAGLGDIDSETGFTSTSTKAVNIPARSVQTYKMGGDIPIGANQARGDYAGNYTVTAEVQTP